MIKNAFAVLLVVAMAGLAGGAAEAAPGTAAPQMNTGLTANRAPKRATVSPTAHQIEATEAIGAIIQNASGADVAKITDLLIDRRSPVVALAIIAPLGGRSFDHGTSAVAWSSLRFEPRPTPHFMTRLGDRQLAAGSTLAETAKTGGYDDVKTDVLGRKVVGANGNSVGHVEDLVLTFGTGHLVALVIDTGGLISIGATHHAVAWDAAKPQLGRDNGPIRVALSKAQIDQAPVTTTMLPAPIPAKAANTRTPIPRNPGSSLIPAPANNR